MSQLATKVSTLLQPYRASETAAPRKEAEYANPVEFVRKGMLNIVMSAYTTFRSVVGSSLLNEAATTAFEDENIGGVLNYDLTAFTKSISPAQMRERYVLTPGDGLKKPILIKFNEMLTNVEREHVDKIMKYMGAAASKTGRTGALSLVAFAEFTDQLGVFPEIGAAMAGNVSNFRTKYAEPLDRAVNFRMEVTREVFNEDRDMDTLIFTLWIEVAGVMYNEVIESDEFSPYLVHLWLHNSLLNTDRRFNKIVDPRKVSRQYAEATKRFGAVRPKVNSMGFAINGGGLPMFIPPSLDRVENFIAQADACINPEDGTFSMDELVNGKRLANQIIYVDWLNDIMAYTSANGVLETFNLGEVHPLDPATEWLYQNVEVKDEAFTAARRIIQSWAYNITGEEAAKYAGEADLRDFLMTAVPQRVLENVHLFLAPGTGEQISFRHLCGYDLENFSENPQILMHIRAYKCIIKALNAARSASTKAKDDRFALPTTDNKYGIMAKLLGTEYVLRTIDKFTPENLDTLRKEYVAERQRSAVDLKKREFEIPNLEVNGTSFAGLLPHQGRIMSSHEKTPSQMITPVQTGGGKTILTLGTAIFAIKNRNLRPIITTKGRLVKGTITEMNAISNGKLNAIPLRPVTIRRMKRMGGPKTFKEFMKWVQDLPPNTIFVNSYDDYRSRRKLFDDLETVEGFGDAPVYTTQYLMIVKLIGFRMFLGDESHMIKNPDSGRSKGSYSAFSQGDVRGNTSGTLVSNTVVDLVGQARSVSPFIFGDDPNEFAKKNDISMGLIRDDETATKIKDRLRATTAYHEANREDWSYMLPTSDDDIVVAMLTAKQNEFYSLLMQEAYEAMLAAQKKKGKKKAVSEDADDDDDDEDSEDDEDDEEGDDDAATIANAKVYLTEAEQFLVAPDENKRYVQWEGKPTGEDLISPKVAALDAQVEAHLLLHKGNLQQNKIIVFGWNKNASIHYIRHSKFAGQALHYTAGAEGEEAVRRFKLADGPVLMVADEGSLREGENLQMTSLILRQQSVWAPGDHEQVKARMYRPDPRGKYNRDNVTHRWILTGLPTGAPSLDMVKMARLSSKFISNARITYEGRPEWKGVSYEFDGLGMLSMDLQKIFFAQAADVNPYLEAWDTFVAWENKINVAAKLRMAEKLEAQTGETLIDPKTKRIIDINRFISLAMYKVTSNTLLQGSKEVYVPWTAGAIPPDPKRRGYVVKGQQQVPNGTVVFTEFGPAVVLAELKKGAKVRLYDGRTVGLRNGLIMIVPNGPTPEQKKKYQQFAAIVTDPQKWREEAKDIFGVNIGKIKRVAKEDVEQVDDEDLDNLPEDDDTPEDDTAPRLDLSEDLNVSILNGWPALVVMDDIEELGKIEGWNRIDPYVSLSFRTWAAADKFLSLLDTKTFIPDDIHESLMREMTELKSGKSMKLNQQFDAKAFRNFFLNQKKKLGRTKEDKIVCHPYWIAIEQEVRLAFDRDSHDPKFFSWLQRNKAMISGLTALKQSGAIWVNLFRTAREAADDLAKLEELGDFDKRDMREALVEVNREIKEFRKVRSRPAL